MGKTEKLQTRAATHSFLRNTLYRDRKRITMAYIHAATHLFERKNLCRGKREKILRREREREKNRKEQNKPEKEERIE